MKPKNKTTKSFKELTNNLPPEEILIMEHLPEPEPKSFQVGDQVMFSFFEYKVVELVGTDQVHIKNIAEPFDSQIVYNTQLNKKGD